MKRSKGREMGLSRTRYGERGLDLGLEVKEGGLERRGCGGEKEK